MKQKKLSSFITLTVSLQMMLAPLPSLAENTNNQSGDKFNKVLNTATNVMNTGMNVYNQMNGGANSGQFTGQMGAIQNSRQPTIDGTFNLATLMQMPGFAEYLNSPPQNTDKTMNPSSVMLNCVTLPPKFHETKSEICKLGRTSNSLNMSAKDQATEAKAYANQYLQLSSDYDDYGIKPWSDEVRNAAPGSNLALERQKGYGCMENMGLVVQGFFAYRINELNKMKEKLSSWMAQVKAETDAVKNKVLRNSAILKGPDHPANKKPHNVMETGDFDYAKRFADPACVSMMPNNTVDDMGKRGGLLAITKDVGDKYRNKPEQGPYSPKDYLTNSATVENEIKTMAKQMSQQALSGFGNISSSGADFGAYLKQIAGEVNTNSGIHQGISNTIFTDIQNSFNKKRNELSGQLSLIEKELRSIDVGKDAREELLKYNNDAVFESEISALEDEIKGKCAANEIARKGAGRIYDPNLSKEANKASTEDLNKQIAAIMMNTSLSEQAKRTKIKMLNLGRFQVRLDKERTYNKLEGDKVVQSKIGASDRLTPDTFFDTVFQDCNAQYAVQKLNKRMPPKQAIAELRNLKKQYNQLALDNSKKIEGEIVSKMINCGTDKVKMNASSEGSCTSSSFDLRSPSSNFCAANAKACAINMKSCSDNATKMVEELRKERSDLAAKYNTVMESKKQIAVSMFRKDLDKFIREGEIYRSRFKNKSGFDTPQGNIWEVDENKRYIKALEGDEVELEDPQAIVDMYTKNIDNLLKQVQKQQDELFDGNLVPTPNLAEKRKKEYERLQKQANRMADDCDKVYYAWINETDAGNKAQQEAFDKGMNEFGEKRAAFCGRYSDIMSTNPIPGCKDGFADVTTAMISAAMKVGNNQVASEASRMRTEMAQVCGEPKNQVNKDGSNSLSASDICADALIGKDKTAIAAVKTLAITGYETEKQICDAISGEDGNFCPTKKKKDSDKNETTEADCSKKESAIVSAYRTKLKYGDGDSGTGELASTDRWSSEDEFDGGHTSSNFCNASYSSQGNEKNSPSNQKGIKTKAKKTKDA